MPLAGATVRLPLMAYAPWVVLPSTSNPESATAERLELLLPPARVTVLAPVLVRVKAVAPTTPVNVMLPPKTPPTTGLLPLTVPP